MTMEAGKPIPKHLRMSEDQLSRYLNELDGTMLDQLLHFMDLEPRMQKRDSVLCLTYQERDYQVRARILHYMTQPEDFLRFRELKFLEMRGDSASIQFNPQPKRR